jgi:hypothetical protein
MQKFANWQRMLAYGWLLLAVAPGVAAQDTARLFAKSNLVAWCIVPFDAAQRGPRERAAMVKGLGLSKIAYDWREEHVPQFEAEIQAYREHGIEFFAFWAWHPTFAELVPKYAIRPQFWVTNPSPEHVEQEERVALAGRHLLPLVEQTAKLRCRLGLYNHGGWGGEPENLIAVCRWLRENHAAEHVGIVYNLHHGHEQIYDFAQVLAELRPYLLCLNLNGMNEKAQPKILPIGRGTHDARILQTILDSGYSGPVGILDHRPEVDAEQSLRENLEGLSRLVGPLGP